MVTSKRGWTLTIVSVILFVFRGQLTTASASTVGGDSPTGVLPTVLNFTADFWWLWLLLGGVLLVRDYDILTGTGIIGNDSRAGGVVGSRQTKPVSREDIIQATNWKRINFLVFRRSVGVSLATAGAVAAIITMVLGGNGFLVTVVAVILMFVGVWVFLTSQSHEEEIQQDYTHRVSVRIPDLFEVHSFHVHLRQAAEDLGYVMVDNVSPGRGGTAAQFDEDIFLSEGGFIARKRPIAPPISPFPEESALADAINLTSVSMIFILVGIALAVTAPSGVTIGAAILLSLVGSFGLLYSYVTRTRNWAKLYCITEGTVHTPTANLYGGGTEDGDAVKMDPTISSPETATELLVTVGARSSRYFDDEQLADDFDDFVGSIDDLAQANSARVLDPETIASDT